MEMNAAAAVRSAMRMLQILQGAGTLGPDREAVK